jgi:hypothetical protein|tara:strand:- start:261 stop:443 length:183 start_codon:yes stop_codon:yes gene_type:complete
LVLIGDKNAFEALLSDRGDDGSTKGIFEIVRTLCAQDCLYGVCRKNNTNGKPFYRGDLES